MIYDLFNEYCGLGICKTKVVSVRECVSVCLCVRIFPSLGPCG